LQIANLIISSQWFVQKFIPKKGVFATMTQKERGWIGVDLDGTLVQYNGWKGNDHIGDPIWPMILRVRQWIKEGKEVKIFTARVGTGAGYSEHSNETDTQEFADYQRALIQDWTEEMFGVRLEVTAQKDWAMLELWDDRAVQVVPNTGRTVVEYWQDLFRDIYHAMGGVQL
jgi:hypothetical protein